MANLKSLVRSQVSWSSDLIQTYAFNITSSWIKEKFGFEFIIPKSLINTSDPSNLILKFIKKYVTDFESRIIDNDSNLKHDFVNISKIDNHTYIYIASGLYYPKSVELSVLGREQYSDNNIYAYIFGKKSRRYSKIFDKYIGITQRKTKSHNVYIVNQTPTEDSRSYDISLINFKNRDLDTLIYSDNEVEILTEFLDKFINNLDYYQSKQLNYKTGILLYSEPGTGKSSLAKALACKYKRSICQINVGNLEKINLNSIASMINVDEDEEFIVLFEDIDTIFHNSNVDRDNVDENKKDVMPILNNLLNFLDSSASPNNVIFIATTNHVEKLDKALIRDGRFDLKLQIKALKKKDIPKFMKTLDYEGSIESVLEAYGEPEKGGLYNQSKLQNIIIKLR